MLAWKSMTLGPVKHEKVAWTGRISNVFRLAGARSAKKAVGIMELRVPCLHGKA